MVLSLSGCRVSLVLQQIIYEQQAEEVDYDNETIVAENTPDSEIKDEELQTEDVDDSEKKEEVVTTPAVEGADESDKNVAKTNPDDEKSDKDSNKKKTPGEETDGDKDKDKDKGGDDTAGPADDPNSREVEDENGNKVTIPENVNKVAATGEAALIAQMLGGKGILVATSSDFRDGALAKKVFSAQNLQNAAALWSGDGSSPMSDANFKKLLKLKPDVCVGMSGEQNFSSAQIKTLKEKKIAYVILPRLNTYSNVVRAVKIAGNMIDDRSAESGGVDAKSLAAEYEDYASGLINDTLSKSGGFFTWNNVDFNNDYGINGTKKYSGAIAKKGKYTLFVSDWDNSATFKMSGSGATFVNEKGVAVSPRGYSSSPISYYMSVAGALNNGARFVDSKKDDLAAVPLNLNTASVSIDGSSLSIYSDKAENFARVWDGGALDTGLGQGDFQTIIVDSAATKSKISGSDTVWKYHGKSTVDSMTDYGFVAESDSGKRLIISYVRGNYDIYVNPYGVADWAVGSPEGILETIWASWRVSGKSSESDVKKEIKNFYSKFYRYTISDSDVNAILKGK